jgi:hypothetical protein
MDDEEASQLRTKIVNIANRFLEAYALVKEGKIKEARVIVYDLDRFDVRPIYNRLIELEFEQGKKDESDHPYPKPTIDS